MKISEILCEISSPVDAAEFIMRFGWDSADGEFVSYSDLEKALSIINELSKKPIVDPMLTDAALELHMAAKIYLGAAGWQNMTIDNGAKELKARISNVATQSVNIYNDLQASNR